MARKKYLGVYPIGNGWRFQVKDPMTGRWKQVIATKKRFRKLGIPVRNEDSPTKAEVYQLKQRYEELLRCETGPDVDAGEQSLTAAIEDYLKYQRNAPAFLADKRRVLQDFVSVVGNLKLGEITKSHVHLFEESLRSTNRVRKLHANSVLRYLRYLRTFFNYVLREGWILRSPFLNYPISEETPSEIEPYSLKDLGELLDFLHQGNRHYVIWMFAGFLGLGLRSIELRGLEWTSFDETERFIRISESKNPQSRRMQPVPLCLMPFFLKHHKETGPFFPTESGDIPTRNQMNSLRSRIANRFPGFKWGRLRKTYSSILHSAGVDTLIIDRLLGHSARSTGLRISAQYYIGKDHHYYRSLVDEALSPLSDFF